MAYTRPNEVLVTASPRQSKTLEITTDSPGETQAVGRTLGELAEAGDVFLLVGGLGAGKTCLTQGILWGLGSDEYARSPTFVLVTEYSSRLTLYHMDLYRLDTFDEVVDLGLDEYLLGDGVSVVEWAEKASDIFPEQHLLIQIERINECQRKLTLTATDSHYDKIISALESDK